MENIGYSRADIPNQINSIDEINPATLSNKSKSKILNLIGAFTSERSNYSNRESDNINAYDIVYNAANRLKEPPQERMINEFTPIYAEPQPQQFQQLQIIQPKREVQMNTTVKRENEDFMNYIDSDEIQSKTQSTTTNNDISEQILKGIQPLVDKLDTLCKIVGYFVKLQKECVTVEQNFMNNIEERISNIEMRISDSVKRELSSMGTDYSNEDYELDDIENEQSSSIE